MNKSKKKQQLDMQTLKRLLSYLKQYKARFIFVLICILVSAGASVLAALFLETLIDDYITPLLVQAVPDFSGLLRVMYCKGTFEKAQDIDSG